MVEQHREPIAADRLHQLHPSGKHGEHWGCCRSDQVMAHVHAPVLAMV
ncbi:MULTISPECIES: hypothetical protein [unclassified Synechococcus]|nr:hypothetical protein [Synechococcus sp. MIT S9220]